MLALTGCETTQSAGMSMGSFGLPARGFTPVARNSTSRIYTFYDANGQCQSQGPIEVQTLVAPEHGRLEIRHLKDHPLYPAGDLRAPCNRELVDTAQVFYHSDRTFTGPQETRFKATFPSGTWRTITIVVNVE